MGERVRVDTAAAAWENGLDVVRAMAPEFRANLGPQDRIPEVYVKYHQKTLRVDPNTRRRLDLIRLDPGYRDLTNAYHDSVEECFVLGGSFSLDGEGHFTAGDYFWRPPGWVHAAETPEGFLALLSLQGLDPAEGSGEVSRRIRPDSEAGSNALHAAGDDAAMGPRGWVRCQHTSLLAWQPGPVFARDQEPLEGFDLDRAAFRVLSRNPWTGAQSLLVRLDPGYAQEGAGLFTAAVEFYVVTGSCLLGGEALDEGSYLYSPSRTVEPALSSQAGATLFLKADGRLGRRRA